jgi:PDZ domain-containing protein
VSRRALTLLLASLLALGLAAAGAVQRVPYVSLGPGPAINTLDGTGKDAVLSITGARTYPADGTLSLTTVSVRDHLTLFEAIYGWVSSRQAVIPREIVYPPGKTDKQQQQQNVQEMQQSQDAATTAALRQLGIPSTTTVVVASVTSGAPADGKLKPADVLTTIDGAKVTDALSVSTLIRRRTPGDPVTIGYLRDGKAAAVTLTTTKSSDSPVRPIVGIVPGESSTFPIKVDIRLKDIGGPSAGLMFALGIIEKLGPDSITGGRHIAGTGEITADGTVGPIGGIVEKMIGAKDKGATVFLSPAQNCAEAKGATPDGVTLIKVSTLKDALAALKTLREGGAPPSC